jgi:hypothetical protein
MVNFPFTIGGHLPGIHPANSRPNRQNGCSEGSNSTGLQRPDQRKWNSFGLQSISHTECRGARASHRPSTENDRERAGSARLSPACRRFRSYCNARALGH